MKVSSISILSLILLFISNPVISQNNFEHKCGTDHSILKSKVNKYNKLIEEGDYQVKRAKRYVPIKFQLVGNSDGTGRMRISGALRQLCVLAEDYKEHEFIPYIDGDFKFLNNTAVNTTPWTTGARNTMINQKDPNAVNMYFTSTADLGPNDSGSVLGYYDPGGDFILIKKNEAEAGTASGSHELGHFLSLMHTFLGWEQTAYNESVHGNPVTVSSIDGSPIEVVNMSNCLTAGDGICDTPPDYLFAFSSVGSGCGLNKIVRDRNNDEIETMADNMMSYFPQCSDYIFTNGQEVMMQADFDSGSRSHIRTGYVPNEAEITEKPNLVFPEIGGFVEVYNSVLLDWDPVDNAEKYLVEVNRVFSGEYFEYITTDTELLITDLEADEKVSWLVVPFNETSSCMKSSLSFFDTGTTTNVANITEVKSFEVFPNPSDAGSSIDIYLNVEEQIQGNLEIYNNIGEKIYFESNVIAVNGNNHFVVDHIDTNGILFVHFATNKGLLTKKILRY